ncbi:MAG: type II toxin-antitoxin system VapC family toxin [Candidatus Limnocylindria bacterium]
MTRFVIDASAALFALAGPEGTRRLARHDVQAPPLLWSEIAASLRQRVYRKDLSARLANHTLATLRQAAIKRVIDEELYPDAYALAARIGWAKTYDAEYVVLAQRLGCPLLTADARLARGAGGIVEMITAADL